MTFLLDVNVLIALIDPAHIQHDAAHEWFAAYGQQSWATCPCDREWRATNRGACPLSKFTGYAIGCGAFDGGLARTAWPCILA